jgi:hypothetical protein
MNFGLNISCMVEEKLALIQRPVDWTQADEAQAYERCLKEALEENGRAWADGNIRVGDYILLSKSLEIEEFHGWSITWISDLILPHILTKNS